MSPGARNRWVSAVASLAATLAIFVLPIDPSSRAFVAYAGVVTVGYAHLSASFLPGRRLAALTPDGVPRPLFAAFLLVSVASALALYVTLVNVAPWAAAPLLCAAVWHTVENDAAMQCAYPQRRPPGRVLGGRASGVGLAAGGVVLVVWVSGASAGGLAQELATAAFILPTTYHLVSWIVFSLDRARWLARAGEAQRAQRLRRRLLVHHGVAVALSGVLLAGVAPAMTGLFFSPVLYLFWSSIHVLDTAAARSLPARLAPPLGVRASR